MNALSGVDLALWDLLGKLRGEPVYRLLGGKVRDELTFYATGARPDLAQKMGFIGGKMPLHHGPAEGEEGLRKNLEELATMRERVGEDFWLMFDCWMALDLNYATKLAHKAHEYGLKWIEEALSPDDYWGYRDAEEERPQGHVGHHRRARGHPLGLPHAAGDGVLRHHPARRRLVRRRDRTGEDLEPSRQPAASWCIPHGSSVYSYHFVTTRHNSPFAEFLMMAPKADEVVPMFHPQLIGEPVPVNGAS